MINSLNKRDTGIEGEKIALEYLISKGFEIVKTNFHFGRFGEIDIIAKDGNFLVFIEVKKRNQSTYGSALESITIKKVNALRKAAEGYLYVNKITDIPCRFDIIAIDKQGTSQKITHIQNAF